MGTKFISAPKVSLQEIAGKFKDIPWAAYLWLAIHFVLIAILANHQDLQPSVFKRYSLSYAALLAALAIVGIAGIPIIARRQTLKRFLPTWLQALRHWKVFHLAIFSLGLILLLAIWMTPFSIDLSSLQQELLRAYGTVAVLTATYVSMFWRGRDRVIPFRAWVIAAGVICFAVLIVAVHYLDRFPQLNTLDELHNWSAQWTFAHTGLLGEAMYRQMIPLPQPILDSPHYIMGFMLRFFGDTLWQSRFARMLLACMALPFIYLCGKLMYGKRTGVWAVVLAAFLIPPTAYVRPDVFVGLMLSAALYVYWRAQNTRRPWMHYLAGLIIGLAGEGHPIAYRFGLAFALIYFVRWLYEMRQTRRIFLDGRIVALALGGLTAIIIYLSIHIIPNLEQGLHFAKNYGPSHTIADQIKSALAMLEGQLQIWVDTSPLEFVFVALGTVLALRENKQADRLLLTLLAVSEVLMLATYGYYRQFYQVHYLPIFALLGGRVLANLSDVKSARLSAGRASVMVLSTMVFVVGLLIMVQNAGVASLDPMRAEFTAIGRQLKADLPADWIVVGNEDYFLEYRSMNFYGIQTVTTPNWYLVKYQGYALWEVTRPDVFILSTAIDIAKYTDYTSIYRYMDDHGFKLARCYTATGLIEARVYVRQLPPGWTESACTEDYKSSFEPALLPLVVNSAPAMHVKRGIVDAAQ